MLISGMAGEPARKLHNLMGWPEILFCISAGGAILASLSRSQWGFFLWLVTALLGLIVFWRLGLKALRQSIWRLQNRLTVAYLFIGVVPFFLLLIMAEAGAYVLTGQVGALLMKSEIERRATLLRQAAVSLTRVPDGMRAEALQRSGLLFQERYPGVEILIREETGREVRYPAESRLPSPPKGHTETSGILVRDRHFHLWAHAVGPKSEAVIVAPVTRSMLQALQPGLGLAMLRSFLPDESRAVRVYSKAQGDSSNTPQELPPPVTGPLRLLDLEVTWPSPLDVQIWEKPDRSEPALLLFRTRMSGFLRYLFQERTILDSRLVDAVAITMVLFVVFQTISAFIGISLSRSITTAVNNLYEGTERIQKGDLSHRIDVKGQDQLAELGRSFNSMTENLERLLQSEKERQRLQAELEIAREVQSQLHPRTVPRVGTLRITSACNAARMVSGDYFDYQTLGDQALAIAIGDVAGKGISAALLMATLQSAMRSQLRHCLELAAAKGNGHSPVSTSVLVSHLNQQLYASTSPEKYATFFFSVYDEPTGMLTYTNAGHLSPILVRDGKAMMLDTNGMVVGAFPFARYGESQIQLQPGDLLVGYTDGITEPENEYGEMFGEERLQEMLVNNADRDGEEIVAMIADAVRRWTGSPELQDDMTLLVARKV
jgi:sigma-B regulation protein RsbU (phosphoserine phosphatase)